MRIRIDRGFQTLLQDKSPRDVDGEGDGECHHGVQVLRVRPAGRHHQPERQYIQQTIMLHGVICYWVLLLTLI